MKQIAISLLIAAFGFAAQANDSSFPKISVKGIDPGQMKIGQEIKFYGKNAESFMKMLPNTLSAGSKEMNHDLANKYRNIALVSGAYQLDIGCSTEACNDEGCSTNPAGVTCTIQLNNKYEDGDSFEYAPSCNNEIIPDWAQ